MYPHLENLETQEDDAPWLFIEAIKLVCNVHAQITEQSSKSLETTENVFALPSLFGGTFPVLIVSSAGVSSGEQPIILNSVVEFIFLKSKSERQ